MKMLEKLGYVLEGLAAGFQAVGPTSVNGNGATYSDVVNAITKSGVDSFWKNRMLQEIPKDASPAEYEAAIGIINDAGMDGFWKRRSLEKIFEAP